MINQIEKALAFDAKALTLRAYRQQILASNIANADTPNYKAMDIDFAKAMREAQGMAGAALGLARTHAAHLKASGSSKLASVQPQYRTAVQPSLDGNTVDVNIEQAQFAENALHYMAALRFMNGKIQSTLSALRPGN